MPDGDPGQGTNDLVSFAGIDNTLGAAGRAAEKKLLDAMTALGVEGKEVSTQDLLKFQMEMQKWNLMHQTQSTMIKDFGETLKDIVRKAG
jgi:hypothetical protein